MPATYQGDVVLTSAAIVGGAPHLDNDQRGTLAVSLHADCPLTRRCHSGVA
jgi:hypothetical protein